MHYPTGLIRRSDEIEGYASTLARPCGGGRACWRYSDGAGELCHAYPPGRRYCHYEKGPAGWSHDHERDPLIPGVTDVKRISFVGCRRDVLESGSEIRILFVIRHEMEHERQRYCDQDGASGSGVSSPRLVRWEYEANEAGWRAVRPLLGRWGRQLSLLSPVESALFGVFTAVYSRTGVRATATLMLFIGVAIGAFIETWTAYVSMLVVIVGLLSLILALRAIRR